MTVLDDDNEESAIYRIAASQELGRASMLKKPHCLLQQIGRI